MQSLPCLQAVNILEYFRNGEKSIGLLYSKSCDCIGSPRLNHPVVYFTSLFSSSP